MVFSGGRRIKSNVRSRSYSLQYSAEDVSIRICRHSKREKCDKSISEETVLKREAIMGNHFWSRGYFVSTVGIDEEKIKRYVKYRKNKKDRTKKKKTITISFRDKRKPPPLAVVVYFDQFIKRRSLIY